jgi:hypothetical protein
MQAVWGKSEGRIGKLAVNLHVIHALMKGQTPSEEIPVEFIQAAITLTKYYAQQVQSLYTQFSDPDALAPHLANVIQLAQRKGGWIKASDVYLSITKKHRPSGSTVREWFSELVLMGKGQVKGEGRSLQFCVFSDKYPPPPPAFDQSSEKLDDFRQELDKSSNAESTIYQETQELLDKLDDLDNFPKHIMDVEALEAKVDLTTEVEKTSLLDESSNLSNLVQDVQPETDTALDKSSNESSNLDNFPKHIMDVEALEVKVDLTTEVEKTSLLDESSNLSNLVQDVQSETDTALDKSSNESSNLDALDTQEAIAPMPVEVDAPQAMEVVLDQRPVKLGRGSATLDNAIAPDPWEEEYTLVNVDDDRCGELVRVSPQQLTDSSNMAIPNSSPLPQKLSIEEADSTAVEDAIASPTQETWVWNKETGECLGQVLYDGGDRLKIRRTGEPSSRAKWHQRSQITFQNPTVSALSLNAAPTTPVQWEDSEHFLEGLDD